MTAKQLKEFHFLLRVCKASLVEPNKSIALKLACNMYYWNRE